MHIVLILFVSLSIFSIHLLALLLSRMFMWCALAIKTNIMKIIIQDTLSLEICRLSVRFTHMSRIETTVIFEFVGAHTYSLDHLKGHINDMRKIVEEIIKCSQYVRMPLGSVPLCVRMCVGIQCVLENCYSFILTHFSIVRMYLHQVVLSLSFIACDITQLKSNEGFQSKCVLENYFHWG